MSRAFVKDDDGRPEEPVPIPVSRKPNYVTAAGLQLLRTRLEEAEAAGDERSVRYARERIDSAILIDTAKQPRGQVEFGAHVVARDNRGRTLDVRIVGEDEADPAQGRISYDSPVAQALIGHRKGDRVAVMRPAGPMHYTIERVSYPQ